MKCPNCGANIREGSRNCEYCDSLITVEMMNEIEQVNKAGCPRCGSTNITFNREKQGEIRGKKGAAIVHSTVGVCNDCGNTWHTDTASVHKKRKTWLWVLGWIFIFPLPLTLLLLRPTVKLNNKIKYAIIAVAWLAYAIWLWNGRSSNNAESTADVASIIYDNPTNAHLSLAFNSRLG